MKKLILLLGCCFVFMSITGCRMIFDTSGCYLEDGVLNKHPLIDDDGNIVNCYNAIGQQDGKWLYYNESGGVVGVENFKNGELDGKRISYYDNGQIEDEGYYLSGFNHDGERIAYYYNGKIRYVGHYKDGKEDGKWVSYFKNGQVNYVGYYKNGKQDGERISYNEDGEIDGKVVFSGGMIVDNDIENGDILHFGLRNFFEENRNKMMLGCYNRYGYPNLAPERNEDGDIINCFDRSGNMNGKWIDYVDTSVIDGVENAGKVKMEINYLNGKENGKMKIYFANGEVKLEVMYINGVEDGLRKTYYENGQIKSKGNNKNGEKDGKETTYYENGGIESEIMFKNGKQDGESKLYNENGQIILIGYFKDGVKDGNWLYYYDNGIVKFEENYKNGKLDGTIVLYKENGEIDNKAFYKNGNRIK